MALMNIANMRNNVSENQGEIMLSGSFGRSVPFDPFRRTKNIPFRIVGRRRSISVFGPIEETADDAQM